MMNKKNRKEQAGLSYYGLYLLNYLRENRFSLADDAAFVRERADHAAEVYEQAMLEGYPSEGAQELAMSALMDGLNHSRYGILREVIENEFSDEVPEQQREAFTGKLLPEVDNVFAIYDLAKKDFALSPEYDRLYTELTGAVVLYIEAYGI